MKKQPTKAQLINDLQDWRDRYRLSEAQSEFQLTELTKELAKRETLITGLEGEIKRNEATIAKLQQEAHDVKRAEERVKAAEDLEQVWVGRWAKVINQQDALLKALAKAYEE